MSVARILSYIRQLDDPQQGLYQRTDRQKWEQLRIFVESLAASASPAEAGSGPKSEAIEQAARDVGKWLNERPNRPVDLRHVAMLVHHAEAGSGQAATTQAQEAVAEVTHCKPDNYSANHRIRWLTHEALPVGTKLYAAPTQADSAPGDEAQVLADAIEALPRYSFGYKSDEWGMGNYLAGIVSDTGAYILREDALRTARAAMGGAKS